MGIVPAGQKAGGAANAPARRRTRRCAQPVSAWRRLFQRRSRARRPGARVSPDDDSGSIGPPPRSEEHTSELQSLMRISYAVFCLTTKNLHTHNNILNYYLSTQL